jgi:hypothetical protein
MTARPVWKRSIDSKTSAVFCETIGNPVLDFTDVGAVAEVAHRHGLPLVVDGTFTTPYLLRTMDHGADIVINSLTKWMCGHGTAIGGSITDAGRFECSSDLLNKITHCVEWVQRGNMMSVPTDCPQRDERLGWTGDLQMFLTTGCFNMDVQGFVDKWLIDLDDRTEYNPPSGTIVVPG